MRQEHWNKIIEYFNAMLPQEPKPTLNTVRDINTQLLKWGMRYILIYAIALLKIGSNPSK